jgi:uncharacterized DUF497 family protein
LAFEWDPKKAAANFRKHSIRFSEALDVFDDDYALTIIDDISDPNEQRFVTLGMGLKGIIMVVVYTSRAENIRLISARPAEAREREEYERQT